MPFDSKITGIIPRRLGWNAETPLSAAERRALPHIERVQATQKLADLDRDYVFFTHALLFTHCRADLDPVEEWMLRTGNEGAVFALQYEKPLFAGLRFRQLPGEPPAAEPDVYDHVLLGCERPLWPQLYMHLNALQVVDRGRRYAASCFLHVVYAAEPRCGLGWVNPAVQALWRGRCIAHEKGEQEPLAARVRPPAEPPPVRLYALGVSDLDGVVYLETAYRPYPVADPEVEERARQLHEVVFGGEGRA